VNYAGKQESMKWEFTINMHLRRSNGAVHDRDAAPAAPPATRCCHQKATHNVRHRLAIGVSSVFNCTSKQTQQSKHSVGLDLNTWTLDIKNPHPANVILNCRPMYFCYPLFYAAFTRPASPIRIPI